MNILKYAGRAIGCFSIAAVAALPLAGPAVSVPALDLQPTASAEAAIGGGYVVNKSSKWISVRDQRAGLHYQLSPGANSGQCCTDVYVVGGISGLQYRTSGNGGASWSPWYPAGSSMNIGNIMVEVR